MNLKNIKSKLVNIFSNKNKSEITEEDIFEISKIKEELQKETFEKLKKWEDLSYFCGFKDYDKKHILVTDDNKGVTELVLKDLKRILTKNVDISADIETLKLIDSVKLSYEDVEIRPIVDSYAPYRIQKTCDNYDKTLCSLDYAIVDIVFGESVIKNGRKYTMDGIDLVYYLHKINPNVKTCIFTGCYLDNHFSKEKEKIIKLLGEDYLKNNVLTKTPYFDDRAKFFIECLFKD